MGVLNFGSQKLLLPPLELLLPLDRKTALGSFVDVFREELFELADHASFFRPNFATGPTSKIRFCVTHLRSNSSDAERPERAFLAGRGGKLLLLADGVAALVALLVLGLVLPCGAVLVAAEDEEQLLEEVELFEGRAASAPCSASSPASFSSRAFSNVPASFAARAFVFVVFYHINMYSSDCNILTSSDWCNII